jgi:hypothetical protein
MNEKAAEIVAKYPNPLEPWTNSRAMRNLLSKYPDLYHTEFSHGMIMPVDLDDKPLAGGDESRS